MTNRQLFLFHRLSKVVALRLLSQARIQSTQDGSH